MALAQPQDSSVLLRKTYLWVGWSNSGQTKHMHYRVPGFRLLGVAGYLQGKQHSHTQMPHIASILLDQSQHDC